MNRERKRLARKRSAFKLDVVTACDSYRGISRQLTGYVPLLIPDQTRRQIYPPPLCLPPYAPSGAPSLKIVPSTRRCTYSAAVSWRAHQSIPCLPSPNIFLLQALLCRPPDADTGAGGKEQHPKVNRKRGLFVQFFYICAAFTHIHNVTTDKVTLLGCQNRGTGPLRFPLLPDPVASRPTSATAE